MIRIVNWLLTRRCNLNCDYCAIVKDYPGKPQTYPDMKDYHKNEMSIETIINSLHKFMKHNPDCFHIFYGGEPMLRKDLSEIIQYCHSIGANYTIISNNTKEVQPLVKQLLQRVGKINGYTASVDPILVESNPTLSDRYRKSKEGFEFLKFMKDHCDDVVAEITVMKEDQHLIYKLVNYMTQNGINSDLTFIDIAKSEYYDFSNVKSESSLVTRTPELAYQLMLILIDKLIDVHMKWELILGAYESLPSNMDCEIEKNLHNVSIDADGSVRLCLRIRGIDTPENVRVGDLIDVAGNLNPVAHKMIIKDKSNYCMLCNHTCQLMSKAIEDKRLGVRDLVHSDRR